MSSLAMKTWIHRAGTWILLHPRLVTAIAVAAFALAAFVVTPALGIAPPGGGKPRK